VRKVENKDILYDFEEHIQDMVCIFSEYRDLLKEKENALVKGDFDNLSEVIAEEENSVLQMSIAEKKRDDLSAELCEAMGIPQDSGITDIAEKLSEDEGTQLMIKIAKLMEILQEVSLLHYNIDRMITFQMKHIKILENTILGNDKINTYSAKGKYTPNKGSELFRGNG